MLNFILLQIRSLHQRLLTRWWHAQKQPSGGALRKRCSENMQQIYRKTPMPKCDFNKFAMQFYWNHTSAWVFSCKFAAYFQNSFSQNTTGGLLLHALFFRLVFLSLGHVIKLQGFYEKSIRYTKKKKKIDINYSLVLDFW